MIGAGGSRLSPALVVAKRAMTRPEQEQRQQEQRERGERRARRPARAPDAAAGRRRRSRPSCSLPSPVALRGDGDGAGHARPGRGPGIVQAYWNVPVAFGVKVTVARSPGLSTSGSGVSVTAGVELQVVLDLAAVDERERGRLPGLERDALGLDRELAERDRSRRSPPPQAAPSRASAARERIASALRGWSSVRLLGYASTSNRPDQPSSANSVLWAWNMNLPGCL